MLFDFRWLFRRLRILLNWMGAFKFILFIFITHPHFLGHLLIRFLGNLFLYDFRRWILSLFELSIDLFVRSLIWTTTGIRVSVGVISFASLRLLSLLRPGRPNHRLIIGTRLWWGQRCFIIYNCSCPESRCLIINTTFIAMCWRLGNVVFFIRIIMSLDWRLSFIKDMLPYILLGLYSLTMLIYITILKVVIEDSLCFNMSSWLML